MASVHPDFSLPTLPESPFLQCLWNESCDLLCQWDNGKCDAVETGEVLCTCPLAALGHYCHVKKLRWADWGWRETGVLSLSQQPSIPHTGECSHSRSSNHQPICKLNTVAWDSLTEISWAGPRSEKPSMDCQNHEFISAWFFKISF